MSLSCVVQAVRGAFRLDVAFDSPARVVAVEGPSGAGKTSLLQVLAGLTPAVTARLIVDDREIVAVPARTAPPPHRRRIGYVFQDVRLFPHLTVHANIAYGRRFAAAPMAVETAMDLLDLRGLGGRRPAGLSGGEARRVAMARVLCADPAILFLDEPFSGLDERRRDALIPYLVRLRDETGLPMLLVSHDPRDADALAQDRIRIDHGRIVPAVTRPQ